MTKEINITEEKTNSASECEHHYTFKKEELFREANALFSRKICEKCGKEITLSRKSRIRIILFAIAMVLLLYVSELQLKRILPDISYTAKGLVVVLLFCVVLGIGLYRLMNSATYVTYTPRQRSSSQYRQAYEDARRENDERTRKRYEEAALRRQKKWEEKQAGKKRR